MSEAILFRRYPSLAGRIPRVELAGLPTPVQQAELVHAGRRFELLVKRDDLSGLPYGGNKVRKLEFLLAAAQAEGAGRVVTAGAFGSHHALATSIYGRRGWRSRACCSRSGSRHTCGTCWR